MERLESKRGEILKVLNKALDRVPDRSYELSERAIIETLSVALQRGNAFISHSGSLAVRAWAAMSGVRSPTDNEHLAHRQ